MDDGLGTETILAHLSQATFCLQETYHPYVTVQECF